MKKLNIYIQELLKIFLIFLLAFVWIRFLIKSTLLAFVLSILLAIALYFVIKFISDKKKVRKNLKLKEKEMAENIFLSLSCDENNMTFFEKLARKKHKDVKRFSKYILISHDTGTKTLLCGKFQFAPLSENDILEIYNKYKSKAKRIVVLCYDYDKNITKFAENFDSQFLFLDRYETYERLYKLYDFYPEINISYKKEKILSFKDFVSYSFSKQRTKGYLISALLLIFSSIFVKATLYYCIVASLLVVFAIFSQFNHTYNPKESEII